jgi:hypothetical protein
LSTFPDSPSTFLDRTSTGDQGMQFPQAGSVIFLIFYL